MRMMKITFSLLCLSWAVAVSTSSWSAPKMMAREGDGEMGRKNFTSDSVHLLLSQATQPTPQATPAEPAPVDDLLNLPLRLVNTDQLNLRCCQPDALGLDNQLWERDGQPGDRQALLASIDNSLRYLRTSTAIEQYKQYKVPGITRDRVMRSLVRFRQLVASSRTPAELQAAVKREFVLYESVGKDKKGTVIFTAYYEPTYTASRRPTAEYRYPIYRLPSDFNSWAKPHPTRTQLEGEDGLLGTKSQLKGLEIAWFSDRLEAFLVQIQGSARLQMTDGGEISVGYAGGTDYPYTSVGKELAKDGKLPLEGLTLPVLIKYFQKNPAELNLYIPRNDRFVFFRETNGAPAMGSIGVPVTAERSIATDKSLMPPGALALVHTRFPYHNRNGQIEQRLVSRYVLDQDKGSAILGPGRVDYFMGTGKKAGDRAGVTGGGGKLYYLLLKQ